MYYYYVMDSHQSGEVRTKSMKTAMKIAEEWIEVYRGEAAHDGGGWSDGVEQIEIYKSAHVLEYPEEDGELVARSTCIVLADRPDDVGKDGYSESEGKVYFWGAFESICNYEMQHYKAA